MEQEDITQIYETLAPMAGDYVNAQAEQIGQAQRSIGPLAANTMGQSQTAGLGNYTYNRLMRPQVDVMRDEIMTQGYANQLNRLLSDALNTARNNYNRKSRGGGGGGGNNGPTSPSGKGWNGEIEKEDTSKDVLYLTGSEAYNIAKQYNRLLSKSELESISKRPITDHNYQVYKALYNGQSQKAFDLSKEGAK